MNQHVGDPTSTAISTDPADAISSPVMLRRDGMRPLCFSGCLVARHNGSLPGAMLWHDFALYRLVPAGYAVEIAVRLATPRSMPARCHAALFETLDEAVTLLENHDASRDIFPAIAAPAAGVGDPASPAMLAIRAGLLQGFCRDVVERYRAGVGSFLYSICKAGT